MKSLDVQIVITSENFTQRGTGSGQENSKGTNGRPLRVHRGSPPQGAPHRRSRRQVGCRVC